MRDHFRERTKGVRDNATAVAVLEIPRDPAELLRGRSRQALRTNIRHAEQLGTTYRRLTGSREDCERLLDLVLRCRCEMDLEGVEQWLVDRPDCFVAVDPGGSFLAVYSLDVDRECAVLETALTASAREGLYARYGLHAAVVGELSARGVRALCVGPAYGIERRLQYLQHLLGFEPTNLLLSVSR